jgi:hypothetical protein
MDLKTLDDTPPWEWPEGVDKMLLEILRDERIDQSERLLAAELVGDFTVINADSVDVLLSIPRNSAASENLRGHGRL